MRIEREPARGVSATRQSGRRTRGAARVWSACAIVVGAALAHPGAVIHAQEWDPAVGGVVRDGRWVSFIRNPEFTIEIDSRRVVLDRPAKVVQVWEQVTYAEPRRTEDGVVDVVLTHRRFYCEEYRIEVLEAFSYHEGNQNWHHRWDQPASSTVPPGSGGEEYFEEVCSILDGSPADP